MKTRSKTFDYLATEAEGAEGGHREPRNPRVAGCYSSDDLKTSGDRCCRWQNRSRLRWRSACSRRHLWTETQRKVGVRCSREFCCRFQPPEVELPRLVDPPPDSGLSCFCATRLSTRRKSEIWAL
jgi:hypothetical protein